MWKSLVFRTLGYMGSVQALNLSISSLLLQIKSADPCHPPCSVQKCVYTDAHSLYELALSEVPALKGLNSKLLPHIPVRKPKHPQQASHCLPVLSRHKGKSLLVRVDGD